MPNKNTCMVCGCEFEPCKNDVRIKYCGDECRRKARLKYSREWYHSNAEHIKAYNRKYKDRKNEQRRNKYSEDEDYRESIKKQVKQYRRKNPDMKRKRDLITKFGITLEDYKRILDEQGGGCAICGRTENKDSQFSLHVDHCHETGKVRGILCSSCNLGLGKFQDDPILLKQAGDYLRSFCDGKMDNLV